MSSNDPSVPGAVKPGETPLEHLLEWLVHAVRQRRDPHGAFARLVHWFRVFILGSTLVYAVGLVLFLAALEWVGERHWMLAFFLYFPSHVWLFPLGFLTPCAMLIYRKLLWIHMACVVLVVVFYMDYECHSSLESKGAVIRVMTNNIGENHKQSLTPFIESENPDVILLQEATLRGRQYAKAYPGYQMVERGQFVFLSKYPIISSNITLVTVSGHVAIAARCEIEFQGQPLVIYNVHLPTPRRDLMRLRGAGFFLALAGEGQETGRIGEFYKTTAEAWAARIEWAKELSEKMSRETNSFIAAGDFNMPNHGAIYHTFARQLTDAFEKRGRGYGFSFPGDTFNPVALFTTWLRIDYIFGGRGVKPLYCGVEPLRKSQHRAVFATFEVGGAEAEKAEVFRK